MELLVACATNDGKTLINSHFGDAHRYELYRVSREEVYFYEVVENTTDDEAPEYEKTGGGDPGKAKGIHELLKDYKVQVLLSKQFGKNIVRIRKKFLPVVTRHDSLQSALKQVQDRFDDIAAQWQKGEERMHMVLTK